MTRREAGRLGGQATFRRHGSAHMRTIGAAGFDALAKKLGDVGGRRRGALYRLIPAGRIPPPADLGADEEAALCRDCGLDEVPW